MKTKLNAKSALLVVLGYLLVSILAAFFARIFFGGINTSPAIRIIDQTIGSPMHGTLIVVVILLYISLVVLKDSRRNIFFERKPFSLSKRYYLFPLVWILVSLFVLYNVDYSAYSLRDILLLLLATLAIGFNEELVTRGVLLVGLRNHGSAEWLAWLITLVIFSLLLIVNLYGDANISVLFVVLTGGTLLYVSRRVLNNLFVPIGMHALYDTAFFLLTGKYLVAENLPDNVLDIQFSSFLVLLTATIIFIFFGRGLLKQETTGWQ
jgi:hypothetical protein